jgi:hypothetical protein
MLSRPTTTQELGGPPQARSPRSRRQVPQAQGNPRNEPARRQTVSKRRSTATRVRLIAKPTHRTKYFRTQSPALAPTVNAVFSLVVGRRTVDWDLASIAGLYRRRSHIGRDPMVPLRCSATRRRPKARPKQTSGQHHVSGSCYASQVIERPTHTSENAAPQCSYRALADASFEYRPLPAELTAATL